MSDVQPHPRYRPQKWQKPAAGRRMVYSDVIEPGETVETVFGLRLPYEELGPLLDDPVLDRLAPVGDANPADEPELEELGGDGESEADPEELGEPSPPDTDASDTAAVTNGAGQVDSGFEFGPAEPGEPDQAARDPVDVSIGSDPGRTEAEGRSPALELQVETIQANVDRLSAFAESFEEYVADERTTSTRIEEIAARQSELAEATESLSERVASGDVERGSIRRRLDEHDQELNRVVERSRSSLESLRAEFDELSNTQAELRRLTDDLSNATQSGADERSALADRLEDQHQELASIRDEQSALNRSLEALADRSEQGAADRREMRRELEELHEAISALAGRMDTAVQDLQSADSVLRDDYRSLVETAEALDARIGEAGADRSSLADELTRTRESIEALREEFDAQVGPLDRRIEELESTFTAEETQAIQEVIAAERRWLDWQQDR